METMLNYKGYRGTVEYSLEDDVLYGKVVGVKSMISYEGETLKELRNDFCGAVDDYLDLCKRMGEKPEKEYKGTFNVRINPDLHRKLDMLAEERHQSLNATVENALEFAVANSK